MYYSPSLERSLPDEVPHVGKGFRGGARFFPPNVPNLGARLYSNGGLVFSTKRELKSFAEVGGGCSWEM